MSLRFQQEFPEAETKVQADLERDFVEFEGNRLLPAFERSVEILTKKDSKTVYFDLLDQMIQLILEYQGGDSGPFRHGLARVYRRVPDAVEKSYGSLTLSQKVRLYETLHRGWKEMVRDELLNEWTIELSQRLEKLRP